jgi:uncharacterized membrane protein SirB2
MEYIIVLLKCAMEEKKAKDQEQRQMQFAQAMKNEYIVSAISR